MLHRLVLVRWIYADADAAKIASKLAKENPLYFGSNIVSLSQVCELVVRKLSMWCGVKQLKGSISNVEADRRFCALCSSNP